MSVLSELKRRAGPRVRIPGAISGPSPSGGVALRLLLQSLDGERPRHPLDVARLLLQAGATGASARQAIETLELRRPVVVEARHVHDLPALQAALAAQRVTARLLESRDVDVKALRARLGISQEAFALRYGLDVATLRNWEQGRTRPDGPAAVLLQLIDRDPDKVVELLAS